jgi:hypothetical protein
MSWDEFDRRRRDDPPQQPKLDDEMTKLVIAALNHPAGKKLLDRLHAVYVASARGPDADERALAWFEGRRYLVLQQRNGAATGCG